MRSLEELDALIKNTVEEEEKPTFDKLPDGSYDAELIELIDGFKKNTEYRMLTLVFKVVDSDVLIDKSFVNRREYFYIKLEDVEEKMKRVLGDLKRRFKDLNYDIGNTWTLRNAIKDLSNKVGTSEKYRLTIKTSSGEKAWRNVKVQSFDVLLQIIIE